MRSGTIIPITIHAHLGSSSSHFICFIGLILCLAMVVLGPGFWLWARLAFGFTAAGAVRGLWRARSSGRSRWGTPGRR